SAPLAQSSILPQPHRTSQNLSRSATLCRQTSQGRSLRHGRPCPHRGVSSVPTRRLPRNLLRVVPAPDLQQIVPAHVFRIRERRVAFIAWTLLEVRLSPRGDKRTVRLLLVPPAILRIQPRNVAARRNLQRRLQLVQEIVGSSRRGVQIVKLRRNKIRKRYAVDLVGKHFHRIAHLH